MYNKQLCMRLLYFVVIQSFGCSRWLWAEVAHFKLACFGNLAFKGEQSRNVTWQWSHGTHLDLNKHSNLEIGRVHDIKREILPYALLIYLTKTNNV